MTEPKIPRGLKGRPPEQIVAGRPKFLIYGKPGEGKTWTCIDFPNSYFIDTEGGAELPDYAAKLAAAGAWYMGKSDGSANIDTVVDQVKMLATTQHDRKTLVIDSLSWLFACACAEKEKDLGNDYGRDRKAAMPAFRSLYQWIDKLDMNVILTCHEKDVYEKVGKQNEKVGVTYDGPDKFEHLLHLSGRIVKTGSTRKLKIVKSRLAAFPESVLIPWSYEEFAKRYGRDHLEAEHAAITLATTEQAALIADLIRRTGTPEETAAKWLAADGCDTFADLPAPRAEKMITYLTGLLAAQKKEN